MTTLSMFSVVCRTISMCCLFNTVKTLRSAVFLSIATLVTSLLSKCKPENTSSAYLTSFTRQYDKIIYCVGCIYCSCIRNSPLFIIYIQHFLILKAMKLSIFSSFLIYGKQFCDLRRYSISIFPFCGDLPKFTIPCSK